MFDLAAIEAASEEVVGHLSVSHGGDGSNGSLSLVRCILPHFLGGVATERVVNRDSEDGNALAWCPGDKVYFVATWDQVCARAPQSAFLQIQPQAHAVGFLGEENAGIGCSQGKPNGAQGAALVGASLWAYGAPSKKEYMATARETEEIEKARGSCLPQLGNTAPWASPQVQSSGIYTNAFNTVDRGAILTFPIP